MALYYVVPRFESLDFQKHGFFPDKERAVKQAEQLKKETGRNYHVIEMGSVWSTTTLDELMEEIRAERQSREVYDGVAA